MHGKGLVRSFAASLSEAIPEGAAEEDNASTGTGDPDTTRAKRQPLAPTPSCQETFRVDIITLVYLEQSEALSLGMKKLVTKLVQS